MPRKTKENKELNDIKTKNTTHSTTKLTTNTKNKTSNIKSSTSTTNKKDCIKSENTAQKKKTKRKSTAQKKKTKAQKSIIEYYDLPQKYNKTIVKILAQTPKKLFVYWEISDEDIEKYKEQYGENFFETTKPILIIHNNTLNYSFEVEINDFANSWYLHVNDSNSDYKIELVRRPIKQNSNIQSDYIYITSSNDIELPNDHILFNPSQKMLYFRNVKTNKEIQKPTSTLSFIRNMGKIYDIYDLYKNENNLDFSNPSSHTLFQ